MITAGEKLMYAVMKAIYDSSIPISFKGSMVLKAYLLEVGYTEETRHPILFVKTIKTQTYSNVCTFFYRNRTMKSNDRYLTELNNELEAEGYESEYVCACLEYAENLLNAGLPVIFDPKHFALLLGMDFKLLFIILRSDDVYRYRTIRIPKKHGGYREINMPSMNIKYMQRWILDNILNHMHFSEASLGFRQGTSIVRNAAKHLNKNCILSLDIKDFFPSITYEDVFEYSAGSEPLYPLERATLSAW